MSAFIDVAIPYTTTLCDSDTTGGGSGATSLNGADDDEIGVVTWHASNKAASGASATAAAAPTTTTTTSTSAIVVPSGAHYIASKVWLGGVHDALDVAALKRINVKAVLSVGSRFDLVYSKGGLMDDIHHVVIQAQDEPETNLLSVMHEAADFIEAQNRLFASTDMALLVHW